MIRALSSRSHRAGTLLAVLVLTLMSGAPATAAASPAHQFTLRSAALSNGAEVPLAYVYNRNGCEGQNRSPPLSWRHPPPGTRSFAVLILDSDVAGGWWHWLVFDLPPSARALPAGAGDPAGHTLPVGAVQGRNDYGTVGYGGPCPPLGPAHHYHIIIYALDVRELPVPADAAPGAIAAAVRGAAIAESALTVLYGR